MAWVPSDYEGYLATNVNLAPWDNIYVRRAVAYALDRANLVRALGIPGQPVTTLIPPDQLGVLGSQAQVNALTSSLPNYPYSLAKAKAELALSPYPHGFTATTDTLSYGTYTPVTEVIAAQLQKIGIKLKPLQQVHLARVHAVVELGPVGDGPQTELTAECGAPPKGENEPPPRTHKKTARSLVKLGRCRPSGPGL